MNEISEHFGGLKVLMISMDRNVADPSSAVAKRMVEYGELVEELHIVLMSDTSHNLSETKLGRNVYVYPTNSSSKWFRPRSAAKLGKKIVLDHKFVRGKSLITTQDPFECGWAGLKVKKKWRLPLEVQLHTDPFSPYFGGGLDSVRKRLAKKVLPKADSIRVVSEALKQRLQATSRKLQAEISVLPIYIDRESIEAGQVTFDLRARFGWRFILLSVARLTSEKNLSMAIRVLARVRQTFPDIGLVVVGDGPEKESLQKLAGELGQEKYVVFEGWTEGLTTYYKTANVFVQTSLFEGYGMALVEAGLLGLPVVSTPVGLAQELENGKDLYVVNQGDIETFAAAIADLIEHNDHRENLRINMKRSLENKLISKEDYLTKMKQSWEQTASRIDS